MMPLLDILRHVIVWMMLANAQAATPTEPLWWCYANADTSWNCYHEDAPTADLPVFIGTQDNIDFAWDQWNDER